ncbi:MAG: hypothetical protein JWP15_958 [Alphaproteobacteria bacterium]|nr:hypothetical protein [Alphaproteobacteria bacterium]
MRRLWALPALAAIAAAAPADPVDTVALVLASGMAAEAAGNGRAMLDAAGRLDASGARAEEGDLAMHWRDLARSRGIRDRVPPLRGRALGPAYRRGTLDAGAELATEQVFLAGQKAVVALVPQPGRNLSILVASPDKPICARDAQPPRATCSWLPLFTSRVRISVSNRGANPATYYLVSN